MSSSGGGLFDERRDSNPSLGAFVFSPAVALADLRSGLEVLRTMVEREMQELPWLYPERFLNEPLKQRHDGRDSRHHAIKNAPHPIQGRRRSALGGNRCGVWLCATSSLAGIVCRQSSVQNEHGCGKKNRHSSCESL